MSRKIVVKVEIPSKGVVKKRVKNAVYAYYAIKSYRNEKGNPTCDRVCIGKISEEDNKLIPNRNYYEVFQKQPVSFMDTLVKGGMYGVFKEIAKRTGLETILEETYPKSYLEILSVSHYLMYGSSSLYLMEDWNDDHITFSKKVLSSPELSRMLEEIDADSTTVFFREWTRRARKEKELIAYDVTSISTYSRGIEDAEWGYNRDEETLPQINYGMFYGQESLLPLYYRTYPGSITDKVHMHYMTEDTDMLEIKKASFVMDRGFYTEENLKYLVKEKGIRFMIPVPGSLKFYDEMLSAHKDEITNNYNCYLNDGTYFGEKYEVNRYGFRMNVHIFYNPEKVALEIQSFKEKLEGMKSDLSKMEIMPSKSSNYCKFFDITQKDGYLVFTENLPAINKELSQCGFFMIAETIFTLSTVDVLNTYRRRDTIEKSFDDLKNELDIKRLRCHRTKTVYGKMFIAFLTLIVKSVMMKNLKNYMQQKHYSLPKIIAELDKIRIIYSPVSPNGYRLFNPLTKTQKEILENLNVPENFVDYLV